MPKKRDRSSPSYHRCQKNWYQKNKQRILDKKREQYANDPEFRARAKERAQLRTERLRAEGKPKRAPKPKPPPPPKPPPVRSSEFEIVVGGAPRAVVMHTIGYLSELLGVSMKAIRRWESEGILPAAVYRDRLHHRLYTDLQVRLIHDAFLRFYKRPGATYLPLAGSPFHRRLQAIWAEFPQGVEP